MLKLGIDGLPQAKKIDWIATTQSGAVYKRIDGKLTYEGRDGHEYFHNGYIAVLDRDKALEYVKNSGERIGALSYASTLPKAEVPELGKSLFVSAFKNWRISTDIVSLEFPKEVN